MGHLLALEGNLEISAIQVSPPVFSLQPVPGAPPTTSMASLASLMTRDIERTTASVWTKIGVRYPRMVALSRRTTSKLEPGRGSGGAEQGLGLVLAVACPTALLPSGRIQRKLLKNVN